MSHAPFSPSATKRWLNCQGSFGLSLQVPEPKSSTDADEGTRLHGVAAAVLTGAPLVKLSAEDRETLKPYLDYVGRLMKAADWHKIEQCLEHSPLLFGTPDALFGFVDERLLEVVDLKTGAGILVDPVENEQLLTYAYLALSRLGLGKYDKVRLTIVQPPDEGRVIKSWDTTTKRVWEHGHAVEQAIENALAGGAELVPGEWCRFCKAKPTCPRLRGEVVEALGGALPSTMTVGSLAQWLDRADRMEGFINNVREVGHTLASAGVAIPGWTLKPKRATRRWDDEDAVLEIARRRKIKIYQDKMLSPAMAEKEHKNLPEEIRQHIVAVSSGMNLVRGEAPVEATKPDAPKMEKLMANFKLMKYRK